MAAPIRVLVVDDSVTVPARLIDVLRADGYDVVAARSGDEAIEMLAGQQVDCLLLDVASAPTGGGAEACRRLKGSPTLRDLPLIVLTAHDDRDAMLDALAAGADDVVSAGSALELVAARVRAQIRRRAREQLLRSELADELARKNKELEAFSYSVSHDLRAPLRSISGFSQAVLRDQADKLDERGRDHLRRVVAAAGRMDELIDDLLQLSRVTRAELVRTRVDLGELARAVFDELARKEPARTAVFHSAGDLSASADLRLIRLLIDNLIGNAWKFTAHADVARIELGAADGAFFVRDNGAGFDMQYAGKLFAPFQRLHREQDFPGTGIGLSISQRIVDRHGGRISAEGVIGRGATIWFTLPAPRGDAS